MYVKDCLSQGFALIDKSWVEATEQGAFSILDNRLLRVPGQPSQKPASPADNSLYLSA